MDRSHAFDIHDAKIHGAFSAHFEDPRVFCSIVPPIFRSQSDVIARRTGTRRSLAIALNEAVDVIHCPKHGKEGGGLIAPPKRWNIALQTAVQLQAEWRGHNHISGPLVLVFMEMACVEIDGEEDRMRKGRTERFENEHRIVGIATQDADRLRPFSFVLYSHGQGADVVKLTGALGAFLQSARQRILSPIGLGWLSTHVLRTLAARRFAVETAKIAVPENV